MILAFFPFIIADLYWQDADKHYSGYWAWLLPASIQMINFFTFIFEAAFRNTHFESSYADLLLSLAGIMFFILCWRIIQNKNDISAPPASELSPSIGDILNEHNLSEREKEIAFLLLREGLSNEEMGERLFISPLTIKSHVSQIYQKFGVKRRAAFLATVLKNGKG